MNDLSITGAIEQSDNDYWPELKPIPAGLLPVESFDYELLPASLRPWIHDIAERMQCPPDFPAVGAMVALSSAIGRKAAIMPKQRDDWTVIGNLWGCVVGRPGVMKSPALSEVLKPLKRLEMEAGKDFKAAKSDYDVRVKIAKLEEKEASKASEKLIKEKKSDQVFARMMEAQQALDIVEPVARRYQTNNATVESLGEILIENPWGVLAYRDELHSLLKSLDKEGQEDARCFYLQAYDGNQSYVFDRIGKNLRIPSVCLSLLGGIQPGKLQGYIHDAISGNAGDDGLIQRFGMLVWPDARDEWINVDEWPQTKARQEAFDTFVRLDQMPTAIDEDGEPEPVKYRFSLDAQAMFNEWRQELEAVELKRDDMLPAMESHLAKYRKLVPAIALVCALADGDYDEHNRIGEQSLNRALAWGDYLKSHAERAYAAGAMPSTSGAKSLLSKIKIGLLTSPFKAADVYLKGWSGLDVKMVHNAADMLSDLGYLMRIEIPTTAKGGRPSVVYHIRPELVESGHE